MILAKLKLRLLLNGLKADRQRRVGLPLIVGLMLWVGTRLAGRYLDSMATLSDAARAEFSLWAALAVWVAWAVLPIILFPIDETLDPMRFATIPIERDRLLRGLTVAGLITPSVLLPLLLVGANIGAATGAGGKLLATLMGAVFLVQLVLGANLVSTGVSAILRGRRGSDLALVIVASIGLSLFAAQQAISRVLTEDGLERAVTEHKLSPFAWLFPPAAAQQAVNNAGSISGWVVWPVVAIVWVLVLARLWARLLDHVLVTPEAPRDPGDGKRRRATGLAHRGLWSPMWVMARKELRFYLRDPRQRMVWTGAVIFLGVSAAAILVGTDQVDRIRDAFWLPLLAPFAVLFIGLPIALNQFGWERNAASFLFALPIRARRALLGKNVATAFGLAIETLAVGVMLAMISDRWEILIHVPALAIAAIGCQLAVGNMVSVLVPLRLPNAGTDIFAQASEQGCLAIGAQLVSFAAIGAAMILPGSATALAVSFGARLPFWISAGFSVLWGVLAYSVGIWLSGLILRRRLPEVVAWVQTV